MVDFPLLSILLGIPVLGILFMSLIRANNANAERNLKQTALWISFLNFLASILNSVQGSIFKTWSMPTPSAQPVTSRASLPMS